MKYITGIHALNLPCSLETCGDWHMSGLRWVDITYADTETAVLGDWGIETCNCVPEHEGEFYIANTIRACLDLLIMGNFATAQGMNEDFICNENYDSLVFEKALQLRGLPNWGDINAFMLREYKLKWFNYLKKCGDMTSSSC